MALGGESTPDAELVSLSTVPVGVVADALGYLLSTLDRINMEAEQIKKIATQRGLQDKAGAVEGTLDKVRKYAQTVSQTLQATHQGYSS